jgi:hypothetical protein
LVDDRIQHIPDDEQQLAGGEAPPDQGAGWPVAAHPDHDGTTAERPIRSKARLLQSPSRGSRKYRATPAR